LKVDREMAFWQMLRIGERRGFHDILTTMRPGNWYKEPIYPPSRIVEYIGIEGALESAIKGF